MKEIYKHVNTILINRVSRLFSLHDYYSRRLHALSVILFSSERQWENENCICGLKRLELKKNTKQIVLCYVITPYFIIYSVLLAFLKQFGFH